MTFLDQYRNVKPNKGDDYISEVPSDRRSRIAYEKFEWFDVKRHGKLPQEQLDNHPLYSQFNMRNARDKRKLDPVTDALTFYPITSHTTTVDEAPAVAMYGVSRHDGHPIYVEVTGFRPYLYVGIPTEWVEIVGKTGLDRLARSFHRYLSKAVEEHISQNKTLKDRYANRVTGEVGQVVHQLCSTDPGFVELEDLIGYRPVSVKAIKVEVVDPNIVPIIRGLCYHPLGLPKDRCAFCYEAAYRRSISRGVFDLPTVDPNDKRQLYRHHQSCPCLVHMECSEKYGEQLKKCGEEFLHETWFSRCPSCRADLPRTRLTPKNVPIPPSNDLRTKLYGEMEEYKYRPWIIDFLRQLSQDTTRRIILPPPSATALEDMVIAFEASKNRDPLPPSLFTPYAADTRFHSRLLMDQSLSFNWLTVPAKRWSYLNGDPKSIATHEVQVAYENLRVDTTIDESPEFVVVSWDLEMETFGTFPQYGTNAILQSPIKLYNTKTRKEERVLFAIGKLPEVIDGSQVFSFDYNANDPQSKLDAEKSMLEEICTFFDVIRPNVVVTYNGGAFDMPYFIRRAKTLDVPVARSLLGWLRGTQGDSKWRSDLKRGREIVRCDCKGVFFFDLLYWVKDNCNGSEWTSYKLNVAAKNILGRQKIDLKADKTGLYQRTDEGRLELARYALRDVDLPLDIVKCKNIVTFLLLLAKEFGISPQELNESGNKYIMGTAVQRYAQLIYRPSQRKKWITSMPCQCRSYTNAKDKPPKYEGAKVIKPKRGFYSNAATLDFRSLYPSLMQEYNLCPSSYVWKPTLEMFPQHITADNCRRMPYYQYDEARNIRTEHPTKAAPLYTKHDFKTGFIVSYQKYLGDLRTTIRARAKPLDTERTVIEARLKMIGNDACFADEIATHRKRLADIKVLISVIDTEQSVCKVAMNSIYGIMAFYLKSVAASITLMGRDALMSAKKMGEELYTRANGYAGDLVVVYGDTDSIMFTLMNCLYEVSRDYILTLMNDLSKRIKKQYVVLDMAPEKVYVRMLLSGRKNYAAIMMLLTGEIKRDNKGFKFKKKDSTPMQQRLCKMVLELAITKGRLDLAVAKIQEQLCRIHLRQATVMELAQSGSFTKDIFTQTTTKNAARNAALEHYKLTGQAISTIDRVQFIICDKGPVENKRLKATERSTVALHAEMNGIPYDVEYYVKGLIKVVAPILVGFFQPTDPKLSLTDAQRKKIGFDEFSRVLMSHPTMQTVSNSLGHDKNTASKMLSYLDPNKHTLARQCKSCGGSIKKRPLDFDMHTSKRQRVYQVVEFEPTLRDPLVNDPHALQQLDRSTQSFLEDFFSTEPLASTSDTIQIDGPGYSMALPQNQLHNISLEASRSLYCRECFGRMYSNTHEEHERRIFNTMKTALSQWSICRKECVQGLAGGDSIRTCENLDCSEWDTRRTVSKDCYRTTAEFRRQHYLW